MSKVAFSVTVSNPRGIGKQTVDFNHSLVMEWCTCRAEPWCEHRALVLSDRADMFDLHHWFEPFVEATILVPVLPSYELYIACVLHHAGTGISVANANNEDEFYGVIADYEALNDMRNLYLDHFKVERETGRVPTCGGQHGVAAQSAERAARETSSASLVYDLTVELTGMCPRCHRTENYDDLIPDVSPRAGRPNPFVKTGR